MPENCHNIDIRSFDLQAVQGPWTVRTSPGYLRVTEDWELRPQPLRDPAVDWHVLNRTADGIVLETDKQSTADWIDTARVFISNETGYIQKLVVDSNHTAADSPTRRVWRYDTYGDLDVTRPDGVRAHGIGALYWDLATYCVRC
ncbi:MAG: hypothetical protein ABEI77_00105 [Halorientalis sp.]